MSLKKIEFEVDKLCKDFENDSSNKIFHTVFSKLRIGIDKESISSIRIEIERWYDAALCGESEEQEHCKNRAVQKLKALIKVEEELAQERNYGK